MNNIQLEDFLDFKYLSQIKISPNGKHTLFVVSQCHQESNQYYQNIYMLKDNHCLALTSQNQEANFIYINEDTILFKSQRDLSLKKKIEAGEEWSVFYQLSLNGGEAIEKFRVPLNVIKYDYIDDDHYLLMVHYDERYSSMYTLNDKSEVLNYKKEEQDYEVFNQIPYYFNNRGFTSYKTNRLFIYSLSKNELCPLTDENIDIENYELNQDKTECLYTFHSVATKPTLKTGIAIYHLLDHIHETLLEEKDFSISKALYYNHDILILGNKETTHGDNENDRFFKLNPTTKEITLFNDYQNSVGNSVGSDCRYGGGQMIKVVQDKVYFITTLENKSHLYQLDSQGKILPVIEIEGSIDCFDIYDEKIQFIGMLNNQLEEVYHFENHQLTQKTNLNQNVLSGKYIADYQEVPFIHDGIAFMGFVLFPKDYDPKKKYPAILDIHGGPKTVYGKVYYHEMQLWANMGYFVFFTNPRGSDGRGNDFMDIFGRYGTIDYEDLMAFTDTVIEKYPAIDAERIGVTGGSYGGFMTNWIIGHTHRFKCAATQRSISNWISFYGTSDIGYSFTKDQLHGDLFENIEKAWEQSPIKYIHNMETPTLFIHSNEDYRCPLEQGLQLYTALINKGVESRFVMFKGENHELSRGGKPKHRIRRLKEITDWMEKYLK